MNKSSKQLYRFSEGQLVKLVGQGTYPDAQTAWDRARAIREAGGRPVCFYSEFNGFTVLDDHDQSADVVARIVSMEQRSKAFPG
jgi:hypothetical protein